MSDPLYSDPGKGLRELVTGTDCVANDEPELAANPRAGRTKPHKPTRKSREIVLILAIGGVPTKHIPIALARRLGEPKPITEKTLLKRYRRELDEGFALQAVEVLSHYWSAISRGEGWAIKHWLGTKGGPEWQFPRNAREPDPEVDAESAIMGQRLDAPSGKPPIEGEAVSVATGQALPSHDEAMREYLSLMRPKNSVIASVPALPAPDRAQ